MIRVGTDCSGIEAPIQALMNLGIPFQHIFSCDADPYCQQSIDANYEPKIRFTDITNRDISLVPDIDLYICGFPCQYFSSAGKRNGIDEPRGQIVLHCLEVIKKKKPSYFILENVKGLITIDKGSVFEWILHSLQKIGYYDLDYDILDTKEFGIPQHRERLFIVGVAKKLHHPFSFSRLQTKPLPPLENFVEWEHNQPEEIPRYVHKSGLLSRIPKDSIFIDIGFTQNNFPHSGSYTPSLTTGGNLWCVPLQRHATMRELLSLQKFPHDFKQVVSDTQMKKQIGNSMSVNVLEEIFSLLFSH